LVLQAYTPKSQQNNWLLDLQIYTLYIKIMYQYLPGGGAILEPEHRQRSDKDIRATSGAL